MRIRNLFRTFGLLFSLSVFIFAAAPTQVFAQYKDGQRCGPDIPAEQCPCPPNVPAADCQALIGPWTDWKTSDGCTVNASNTTTTASEGALDQHLFVGVSDPGVAKDILAKYDIGGIFLISTDGRVSDELKTAIPSLQSSAKTPLLIATDQEYTYTVNSFGLADNKKATDLASMSADAVRAEGERFGTELSAAGVNMDFAPDTDLLVDGNSVIANNYRAISSNPDTVTTKAKAFGEGMSSKGVTPVIKHFPGHGHSSGDSHQELPSTPPLSELEQSDLLPFKNLGHEDKMAVMVGHLNVPGLTNGKPASMSVDAYSYLRGDKIGFKGLAITDELAGMAGAGGGSLGSKIADSLTAGADMALFNVSSLGEFESAYNDAKAAAPSVPSGDGIREQKRALGLNMPDANVTPATNTTSTGGSSNSSCCGTGATTISLTGNNNTEKILSFLMNNAGYKFSLVQAAGMTGNFFVESGGTNEDGSIPDSAMNVGPNPSAVSSYGFYGIAQWGLGRWQGPDSLNQFASDHGGKWDDLDIQLRFLVWELGVGENWEGHSPTEVASMDAIKSYQSSTSVTDAGEVAYKFEAAYERCGCTQDKRANAGRNVYTYYSDKAALPGSGSTAATGTATAVQASTSSPSCSGGNGGVANGDFVFYTQWDPNSAWADHPFWGGTIAQNGCGPTGAAEVIATWVDKKITPSETADYITSINAEGQGDRLPEVYAHFGLTAKHIDGKDAIIAGLKAGGMIQISASGSTPFTSAGHFIIIRGITADGQVLLGDPNSPAPGAMPGHARADYNSRPWDLDTIFAAMDSTGVHSLNLITNSKPV